MNLGEDIPGTETFFEEWERYGRSWKALLVAAPLRDLLVNFEPRLLMLVLGHKKRRTNNLGVVN